MEPEEVVSIIEHDPEPEMSEEFGVVADVVDVIPSTPPPAETSAGRRKSTRPRKAPQPLPITESVSQKSNKRQSKPRPPKSAKRKSEAILEDAIHVTPDEAVVLSSGDPTPAKKRRKSVAQKAPTVDSNGPVDLPPIEAGEGELSIPVPEIRIKKKHKFVAADVPPIDCLSFWSKRLIKKIVKRVSVAPPPVSESADLPPAPTEDSEVIMIPPPPAPEEPIVSDLVHEEIEAQKSKKQLQEEAFRKSQPSVLKFFSAPPIASDDSRTSRSDSKPSSPRRGSGPNTYIIDTPTLGPYLAIWKESCRSTSSEKTRNRIFLHRPKGEAARILKVSELPQSSGMYSGESVSNRRRLLRPRPVYIAIHDRERPPVKLIMTHRSLTINRRHPLASDPVIDYEKDSDEEYEEEKEGEDLNSNADGEEEAGDDDGSEADSFFVSDGHFSDADELSDDEAVVARRKRQEMSVDDTSSPATLQLIFFGPSDLENLETADCSDNESIHVKWFTMLRDEAGIRIHDEKNFFNIATGDEPVIAKPEKPVVDWVPIRPELAKFIHGKVLNVDSLCAEFKTLHSELSGNSIKTEIRAMATWTKRPEIHSRVAWYVKADLMDSLGLTETEMTTLAMERKVVKDPQTPGPKENVVPPSNNQQLTLLQFKPQAADIADREIIRN